jgi:hypothetical protein
MFSEGVDIDLSNFDAENVKLNGDYLWRIVWIVIGGVPTLQEVGCM